MSTEKIFNQIGQSEITDRQVSSLALRPNEPSQYGKGGLTGRQLQEYFDGLAKLVISRYNELARILSSNEVLEYLKLPETITNDNLSAISDLINKLVDADGDIVVETPEDDKIKGKIKNILSSQASNIIALQESVEVLNTATGKVPSTVEMHLNEDNYKLSVTIKNHLGDTISTSEIDFPIEESVVGMTFDEETKKLHLSLRNGTSLDVDISDIFTGVVTNLTDPSTNKALAASTGALIINKISEAVNQEAELREATDLMFRQEIDSLRTRLDGLDLPIIQHSLYEHSVVLLGSGADGVYPQATLRLTVLNASETPLTASDVISHLNSKTDVGQIVKSFSGFVEYESSPGATDSVLIPTAIISVAPSTDAIFVNYYDSTGTETSIEIGASAVVYDSVSIVADVAESAGGKAIIECLTLPTENISVTHFYRTSDGKLHWYDGSTWHRVVEKTELGGWNFSGGKISATEWDENEHKFAISSQGIEINRQGTTNKLEFPVTNGSAVTIATSEDIERIDANGEEIANYCLDLNTRLETLENTAPSGGSGGYFEGTAEEYNAAADTVPVGAIVWLTDEEGNLTTAVLDKAILGQMILGTS
jgi:hypothetical protein